MRINVYAQELTNRFEIVTKEQDGRKHYGVRLYTYLPVTQGKTQIRGPFLHHPGEDGSSAITFWGDPKDLIELFCQAQMVLAYSSQMDT